MRKNTRKWRC